MFLNLGGGITLGYEVGQRTLRAALVRRGGGRLRLDWKGEQELPEGALHPSLRRPHRGKDLDRRSFPRHDLGRRVLAASVARLRVPRRPVDDVEEARARPAAESGPGSPIEE